MAVSEDRKCTKEQTYTLLEGAKGKTRGEVDLRPPEFVYPKENRNHLFSHISKLIMWDMQRFRGFFLVVNQEMSSFVGVNPRCNKGIKSS